MKKKKYLRPVRTQVFQVGLTQTAMRAVVLPETYHGGEMHTIGINKSNNILATSGKDGSILLWDVEKLVGVHGLENIELKQYLESLTYINKFDYHDCLVRSIVWSPINDNEFISCDIKGRIYKNDTNSSTLLYPSSLECESTCIIDLTWSKDGRLIAWSTSDGKVHIIDIQRNTYQELSSLLKSKKLVIQRSVAFDPTNNYLITLGDDTIIYIYQYRYVKDNYQFKVLQHITRLMNQSNININYNRISWSPEGEYVSIPSSNKNKTTLITILSRKDWSNSLNLVGHGTKCEVIRYHPKIFAKVSNDENLSNDIEYSNVLATAGSDKTLAIWSTNNQKPIIVLENLVNSSIVDLCWDKQGKALFLASLDGHLSIITFSPDELGSEINDIATIKHLIKPMGVDLIPFNQKPVSTNSRKSNPTIEILDAKDAIPIADTHVQFVEKTDSPNIGLEKNKVDNDVKKDIIPEVIPPPQMNEPEQVEDILGAAVASRSSSSLNKENKQSTQKLLSSPQINGTVNRLDVSKQKVTITKDGRKRIQPILVSSNDNSTSNASPFQANDKIIQRSDIKNFMELDKPSYNVSDGFLRLVKRQKGDETTVPKKSKREMEPVKFIGSVVVNPNTTFSKTRLATPKIRSNFLQTSTVESDESFVLDIKNGSGNDSRPSRITFYKKDRQIWTDFIPKYIHLSTEGLNFWAVSTSDGIIFTYCHTSGKRLLPPMVLGSPLSFLESHGEFLMAITNIGELFVWNLTPKKLHLKSPLSISSLLENNTKYLDDGLSRSDKITLCSITSLGIPLITLSNGSGYLFNVDLGVWQTITESWWAFGSHYWDSIGGDNNSKPQSTALFSNEYDGQSITSLLENKTNEEIIRASRTGRGKFFNKISKNMLMKEGFENLENTISVSHLENRILCCELLGETKDFHQFLISYSKRVCELGLKAKIFEVCNELLGPDDKTNWNPSICGLSKHKLLKEIILECSPLRDSQRILTYFAEKLELL